MANTIVSDGHVIDLVAIDTDWNWYDTLTAYGTSKVGVPIQSIQFIPAATDDKCVIKNGSATGPVIFDATGATAYDGKIVYYHGEELKPFLDVGDGSYNAGARVIITLAKRGK